MAKYLWAAWDSAAGERGWGYLKDTEPSCGHSGLGSSGFPALLSLPPPYLDS